MYDNLMNEVDAIKRAWKYDTLQAIEYILDMQDHYSAEVQRELKQFMRDGARMLAPKEAA